MLTPKQITAQSPPANCRRNNCFNCIFSYALSRYRRFLGSTCRRLDLADVGGRVNLTQDSNSRRWRPSFSMAAEKRGGGI
jgi:hypothetical protein